MRIELREVPLALQRRAAQHLEDVRDTEMSAGRGRARLSGRVCPIFRPDLDEIAYYEFEVDLGTDQKRRLITSDAAQELEFGEPNPMRIGPSRDDLARRLGKPTRQEPPTRGFVILAAGEHDFPMPHWSLERAPVSEQLETDAARNGQKVARVVKVDALAYVAEDHEGHGVANVGQLPPMIEGLPSIEDARGAIASSIAGPQSRVEDDREAGRVEFEVRSSGVKAPKLRTVDHERWERFREGYADTFGMFLDDLRSDAKDAWEIERTVEEFGEGLYTGTVHRVALLQPDAAIEVAGDAAELIEVTVLDRRDGPPALQITVPYTRGQATSGTTGGTSPLGEPTVARPVAPDPPRPRIPTVELDHEVGFELHIAYPDRTEEHLRFFVVPPDAPSDRRSTTDREGGER